MTIVMLQIVPVVLTLVVLIFYPLDVKQIPAVILLMVQVQMHSVKMLIAILVIGVEMEDRILPHRQHVGLILTLELTEVVGGRTGRLFVRQI